MLRSGGVFVGETRSTARPCGPATSTTSSTPSTPTRWATASKAAGFAEVVVERHETQVRVTAVEA